MKQASRAHPPLPPRRGPLSVDTGVPRSAQSGAPPAGRTRADPRASRMADDLSKRAERAAIGIGTDVAANMLAAPTLDPEQATIIVAIQSLKHMGREGIGAVIEWMRTHSPDARLERTITEAEADAKVRALIDIAPELRLRIEERTKEDPDAATASLPALVRAWERAWERTADAKKRRVIMAALVRSFDKDSYEEGLSLRFFALLERLDYPELELVLHGFSSDPDATLSMHRSSPGNVTVAKNPRSLLREHLRVLHVEHIVTWVGAGRDPADEFVNSAQLTELGERFRRWLPSEAEKPHAAEPRAAT
jgi:hypothetical protein